MNDTYIFKKYPTSPIKVCTRWAVSYQRKIDPDTNICVFTVPYTYGKNGYIGQTCSVVLTRVSEQLREPNNSHSQRLHRAHTFALSVLLGHSWSNTKTPKIKRRTRWRFEYCLASCNISSFLYVYICNATKKVRKKVSNFIFLSKQRFFKKKVLIRLRLICDKLM
jgi:hypothetical protein